MFTGSTDKETNPKKKRILSAAQAHIIELLQSDPTAYIVARNFWNHQLVVFGDGRTTFHFNKRTREILIATGAFNEFEPNHFRLRSIG